MVPRIWINAGELSGDMQAAALLQALREVDSSIQVMGMGGARLEAAGQRNFLRVEDLSVMGGVEVLSVLPRAFKMLRQIRRELELHRPDMVILVDAPDFNFQVARIAHKLNIPTYYFIPPKVWAWRSGRVKFLQKYIKGIVSILPFEEKFYNQHGIDIHYVGNPLLDMVNYPSIAHIEPQPLRIGIMPGSRKGEVESLLPIFAHTAEKLLAAHPQLSFHCIKAPNISSSLLEKNWQCLAQLYVENPENPYAFMRTCNFILAASGTATLEAGLAGVPVLAAYRVSPLSYHACHHFISAPWMSLSNLILNKEVVPEFVQDKAHANFLAPKALEWLEQPAALLEARQSLVPLQSLCGPSQAPQRAAAYFCKELIKKTC